MRRAKPAKKKAGAGDQQDSGPPRERVRSHGTLAEFFRRSWASISI
jgi:hypothetical protein